MTSLLVGGLALALTASACAAGDAAHSGGEEIKTAGILTVEGDCKILTDPNGRKFALIGKLDAPSGVQVRVAGKKVDKTACLDGPTIRLERVEILAGGPGPAGEGGKPELAIVTTEDGGGPPAGPPAEGEVRMFRLRGALNDEVKAKDCQGFRDLRGDLWALVGDLKSFKTGDKVELEGIEIDPKGCNQRSLRVNSIDAYKE